MSLTLHILTWLILLNYFCVFLYMWIKHIIYKIKSFCVFVLKSYGNWYKCKRVTSKKVNLHTYGKVTYVVI